MNFTSILRHWFTLAATSATVWLIAALTLSADDASALTDAFGKLVEPLIIIAALLAAALWRIFLTKAGEYFRRGAGENGSGNQGSGPGVGLLLLLSGTTVALVGALPSCSPGMPIRIGIQGPDASVSYSSKGGLAVEAVVRATK